MARDYGDEHNDQDGLTRADETVLQYLEMYIKQHIATLPEHRRHLMRVHLETIMNVLL